MADITATSLTSGSGGGDTSFTTASITPSANKLILLGVNQIIGFGTPTTPTASGNGLTWVQIATIRYNPATNGVSRVTLFRSMGASPSTGAITIDFAGQTQTDCSWTVAEFGEVDTTGTNGSGAVVQSATQAQDDSTSITVTLAAFSDTGNATYGCIGNDDDNVNVAVGTGFTQIHDVFAAGNDAPVFSEWKTTNDTTVDASGWGSLSESGGIAIEIKNATQTSGARRIFVVS